MSLTEIAKDLLAGILFILVCLMAAAGTLWIVGKLGVWSIPLLLLLGAWVLGNSIRRN